MANSTQTEPTPLKSLAIPNVGEIAPRGLIVVVGPNSSGKTQLLRDIEARLVGQQRDLVVCDEIKTEVPESFDPFVQRLISTGCIRETIDENGTAQLQQWSVHVGKAGGGGWSVNRNQFQNFYNKAKNNPDSTESLSFFRHAGVAYVTSLFLDRRLQVVGQSPLIDYESKPSTTELQALYVNKEWRRELREELMRVFRKAVWLDNTRGLLCLRVNDSPVFPTDADRLEPEEMQRYRTIENEGDGLKSYTGICVSLLVGRRPVCLIDEPEMCLHPPQAYALGRFIGKHGTSTQRSTFVATHSSHVLRGIIEATEDLQVLRLSRVGTHFTGNIMPYKTLKACIERPSTKIETILDGVFSEAVTIVESEGDRIVYSAAWEKLVEESRTLDKSESDDMAYDIHFVSVGGVGGIANTCRLYRQLKIPLAVIADLDLINKDQCKPVLLPLVHADQATAILGECNELVDAIRKLEPSLTEADLKKRLVNVTEREMDWSKSHDQEVRRELAEIVGQLSRLSVLKRGGIANFFDNTSILHKLNAILLFLVEVGELEYWLNGMIEVSKSKKPEWANEAALLIRRTSSRKDDIWGFIRKIATYQRDQANQLGGYP